MKGSLNNIAAAGKAASIHMQALSTGIKNSALEAMAIALRENKDYILQENQKDVSAAEKAMSDGVLQPSLYKRLLIDEEKIESMASGLESIIKLDDPVGQVLEKLELDSGLILTKQSCPIGLLGIIFESRPDVVPQVMGLSLKSGNAVIFKGGKEALFSNRVLFEVLYSAAIKSGVSENFAAIIETREDVSKMLELDRYFDLFIPRGSNQLVRSIMENTRVPVLGHADGICNMYIEKSADTGKAIPLVVDAKTQYPAVCNAIENLLIHEDIAPTFLLEVGKALIEKGVELRGDKKSCAIMPSISAASETDWSTEYNDLVLAVKIVSDTEEAIDFINTYGSSHTDAIVTSSEEEAAVFRMMVDSSSVLVNASTRFADGFRYGRGAEIGISTNKTHARGPVGLEGLVIYKYFLDGDGHIVEDYTGSNAKKFLHKRLK